MYTYPHVHVSTYTPLPTHTHTHTTHKYISNNLASLYYCVKTVFWNSTLSARLHALDLLQGPMHKALQILAH